jgi:hypothetical protein
MSLTKVSYSMITGGNACIFDFMTSAQIAAVQAHTYAGTDLHLAFQAAFDSKPESLFIPKGLYPLHQTITVSHTTRMYGESFRFSSLTEGAELYGIGAFILLDVAARDVIIERLLFTSGGTGASANTALIYPTIANVGEHGTYNLRIRDCSFNGGNSQFNGAFNPSRLEIRNCLFNGTADTVNAVQIIQNTDIGGNPVECFFDNNVFMSLTNTTAANSCCMYFDSVDTMVITRNNCQSSWKGGIDVRKTKTYTNNLFTIDNNHIEDMQAYGIRGSDVANITVVNNEIVGNLGGSAQYGILLTNANGFITNNLITSYLYDGINLTNVIHSTIAGNKINDINQSAGTNFGVRLTTCSLIAVTGNSFSGNDNQAQNPTSYIQANTNSSLVTISGNVYNGAVNPVAYDASSTLIKAYDTTVAPPFRSTYNSGAVALSASNDAVAASSGTLSLTIPINTIYGSTGTFAGILVVSNLLTSFIADNTTSVYSVSGHGTAATFTLLNSTNGVSGGAPFTLAMSADGVITMTNTYAGVTAATMSFFGIAGAGS